MSLRQKPTKGIPYWLFTAGREKTIHLGPVNDPSKINPEKVREALDYVKRKYEHYTEIEYKLLSFLPHEKKIQFYSESIEDLYKQIEKNLKQLPDTSQRDILEQQINKYRESLRRLEEKLKKETAEHEDKIKILDYEHKQELGAFLILEMFKLEIVGGTNPRKAVLDVMQSVMDSGAEGVGIRISGKLEGRYHRTEKYVIGNLQDLDFLLSTETDSSKIDKAESNVFTLTGPVVIGIVIAKKKTPDKEQPMKDVLTQTKKRKH